MFLNYATSFYARNVKNLSPNTFLKLLHYNDNNYKFASHHSSFYASIPKEKITDSILKQIIGYKYSLIFETLNENEQTYELCKIAVSAKYSRVRNIKNKSFITNEILKICIQQNNVFLKEISENCQTDELIEYAININISSIFYIKNKTKRDNYIKQNLPEYLCCLTDRLIQSGNFC